MKKASKTIIASILLSYSCASASLAEGLSGSTVLVTNMFKGNSTNNVETDVAAFGLTNNLFSEVDSNIELPNFITLYNVDIDANSVSFDWVESDFSKKVGGAMPSDKHDRNYFVFDLPEGTEITSILFDADNSSLHPGSALPTATLISPNKFMTEFADGVIREKGFKPKFIVELANMNSK